MTTTRRPDLIPARPYYLLAMVPIEVLFLGQELLSRGESLLFLWCFWIMLGSLVALVLLQPSLIDDFKRGEL